MPPLIAVGIGKQGIEVLRYLKGLAWPLGENRSVGWLGITMHREDEQLPSLFPLEREKGEVVVISPQFREIGIEDYPLPWWSEAAAVSPTAARLRGRMAWFWDNEIEAAHLIIQRLLYVFRVLTNDLSRRVRVFMVADISEPIFPLVLDLAAWLRGVGYATIRPQSVEISLLLIGKREASVSERRFGAASLRELSRVLASPYHGWVVSARGDTEWSTRPLFDYVFIAEEQRRGIYSSRYLPSSVAALLHWLAEPSVGKSVSGLLINLLGPTATRTEWNRRPFRFALWQYESVWLLRKAWCAYDVLVDVACDGGEVGEITRDDFFAAAVDEDVLTLSLHLRKRGKGRILHQAWDALFKRHVVKYANYKTKALPLGKQVCWSIRYVSFLRKVLAELGEVSKRMMMARSKAAQAEGRKLKEGLERTKVWITEVERDVRAWKKTIGVSCIGEKGEGAICKGLKQVRDEWKAWVALQEGNPLRQFWETGVGATCKKHRLSERLWKSLARDIKLRWGESGFSLFLGKEIVMHEAGEVGLEMWTSFLQKKVGSIKNGEQPSRAFVADIDCLKFNTAPRLWFSAQCKGGCGGRGQQRMGIWPKQFGDAPFGCQSIVKLEGGDVPYGLMQFETIDLERWDVWEEYMKDRRVYEPDPELHPFLAEHFATSEEKALSPEMQPCWDVGTTLFAPEFVRFWACPEAVHLVSYAWLFDWMKAKEDALNEWVLKLPGRKGSLAEFRGPKDRDWGTWWLATVMHQMLQKCVNRGSLLSSSALRRAVEVSMEVMTSSRWKKKLQQLQAWLDGEDRGLCSWAQFLKRLALSLNQQDRGEEG